VLHANRDVQQAVKQCKCAADNRSERRVARSSFVRRCDTKRVDSFGVSLYTVLEIGMARASYNTTVTDAVDSDAGPRLWLSHNKQHTHHR
jgi:hypothetical protein